MRVPVYEVKVNGASVKALRISISQSPKNYIFQANLKTVDELLISSDVEISFFSVPLIRGKVLKEKQTPKTKEYWVSLKIPKIPKTYIANKPLRETSLSRRFIYGENAAQLFAALFAQYGYTLYFDEAPPLICYGREVEGNLVQILADYFRDFAPIISVDPLSNTVYILFHGLSKTWNIPEKVIFDYEISREERDINAVVITNGVKSKEKEPTEEIKPEEDTCNSTVLTVQTSSKSENSETINTYEVDLKRGIIRLVKSETVQYGILPFTQNWLITWSTPEKWNKFGEYNIGGKIRRGIISKTITTYNPDGTYNSVKYGWVEVGREWVVIDSSKVAHPADGISIPYSGNVGLTMLHIYDFVPISETNQRKTVRESDLGCYVLKKTTTITETKDYVYVLAGGGMLTRKDALKFVNLLPGDTKVYTTVKTNITENITLTRKDTGETSVLEAEFINETEGPYSSNTLKTSFRREWNPPPIEETIPIEEIPAEKRDKFSDIYEPSSPYAVKVEHEDIDFSSLTWAKERVKEMYKKHSIKGILKIPLLPVRVGEKVFALSKLWIIEGFSHEITPKKATTTLYLREA